MPSIGWSVDQGGWPAGRGAWRIGMKLRGLFLMVWRRVARLPTPMLVPAFFSARFAPDLLSGLAGPGLTGLPACVPLSRFAAGLEDPDAQYNCEL